MQSQQEIERLKTEIIQLYFIYQMQNAKNVSNIYAWDTENIQNSITVTYKTKLYNFNLE